MGRSRSNRPNRLRHRDLRHGGPAGAELALGAVWRTTKTTNRKRDPMKTLRYLTIGGTLLLSALAGTSSGDDLQGLACHADGLVRLLNDAPTVGQACGR